MGQLADFEGTFTVDTDAKRDAILAAANNRGQSCFNAIAPYGGTTTTPPLSLATMKQAYTLDTAAVQAVLAVTGARGNEFLSALSVVTRLVMPGVQSPAPNVYTFQNSWPEGTAADVTLTVTDSAGDVDTNVMRVTLPPGGPYSPEAAASYACGEIGGMPFVDCDQSGATITLSPTEPGTTLTSSIVLV